MIASRSIRWVLMGLFIVITALPGIAYANPLQQKVPPGFEAVISGVGVQLYRKDYPGGNPDFVQVISLAQGAEIALLHGDIAEPRIGEGVYGGDDPRMWAQKLEKYWQDVFSTNEAAFCVTNGQFFFMPEYPTRLPFPLKVDGEIVSDGFGKAQFPDQKLIFELWKDRADITTLTKEAIYQSSAPDIIAGLTEDARKSPTKYVGRTFVGVDDQDRNGFYETVLIFNTKSARQIDAADVLRDFGADKVMMLDGGGSAQLLCQGTSYVSSDRPLPQVIAVFEGDGQRLFTRDIMGTGQPLLDIGTGGQVNLLDTIWIPLAMSPFFLFLFIFVRNKTLGYK